MIQPKIEISDFDRRVLSCFKEQRITSDEVSVVYRGLYPRRLVAKILLPPVSTMDIELALSRLICSDLIHKELTNYTDRPLKEETNVFWISNKGRSFMHRKK